LCHYRAGQLLHDQPVMRHSAWDENQLNYLDISIQRARLARDQENVCRLLGAGRLWIL
jgi:hypothetical protein